MTPPDDDPEPFDLGTVTPSSAGRDTAAPAAEPATSGTTRRRLALVAALFVGIVVGAVVADLARDEADQAASRIAAGSVSFPADGPADPDSLAVSLYNSGTEDVRIVNVDVDGFTRRTDGASTSGVTVNPGTWTEVDTPPADADCGARPSGDVHVEVETTSGEQSSQTLRLQEPYFVTSMWEHSCSTAWQGGAPVVGDATLLSSDDTSAAFTVPVAIESSDTARLTDLESVSAGFSAMADDLPMEIRPGAEPVELTITWTVDDCAATRQLSDATVDFEFTVGEAQHRVSQELPTVVLVELARVAERTCRT